MSSEWLENSPRRAADRLLLTLKTRGPQTVAELGCMNEVCGEAVRQQLQRLANEGLVEATTRPGGVGRPAQVWRLTPAGHARFPDGHAEFAATLLRLIRTELGEKILDRLVQAYAAERQAAYAAELEGAKDLGEKVERLADARTREGYMAECIETADGYLLVENHCPVGAAAKGCKTYCGTELKMLSELFGPDVTVEWTEHIVHGDRRCAYRICPKAGSAAPAGGQSNEKLTSKLRKPAQLARKQRATAAARA